MVFTPEDTLIVRSVEYGDGSEYDVHSSVDEIIPDHYVKRLWRKKVGNSVRYLSSSGKIRAHGGHRSILRIKTS